MARVLIDQQQRAAKPAVSASQGSMTSRTFAFAVAWPMTIRSQIASLTKVQVEADLFPVDVDATRGTEQALELHQAHHRHGASPSRSMYGMDGCPMAERA